MLAHDALKSPGNADPSSAISIARSPGLLSALADDVAFIRARIAAGEQQGAVRAAGCSDHCGCAPCGSAAGRSDAVAEALETDARRLDAVDRRWFEAVFATSLADVRIHVGRASSLAARQLGVACFTVGSDIVFDADTFRPGTESGDALIAHELTHVLQQRLGQAGCAPVGLGGRLERQAASAGQWFARRTGPTTPILAAPTIVQTANPIIVKCGSICPEVIIDPTNGVPCGLADCEFLGFFPTVVATSYCIYRCAINKYAAFIINTRFGPMGPFFTGRGQSN